MFKKLEYIYFSDTGLILDSKDWYLRWSASSSLTPKSVSMLLSRPGVWD